MGIIYKLTSPSGKSYIGQTKRTFNYRWQRHVQKAIANKDKHQCWALNNAIRKYGPDKFIKEVLLVCNDNDLNRYEIAAIGLYQSIDNRFGYNLTIGGYHKGPLSEKSKDNISEAKRKYKNYHLPRNVVEIHDERKNVHGFRVLLQDDYDFTSKNQTMDEKLRDALECYETIKLGGVYIRKNKFKRNKDDDLESIPGVKTRGENGWEFHKKGFQRKSFTSKNNTRRQNLILALEHFTSTVKFEDDEDNWTQAYDILEKMKTE
jgi:hypothetical protein